MKKKTINSLKEKRHSRKGANRLIHDEGLH